jgi:hypothetical protein
MRANLDGSDAQLIFAPSGSPSAAGIAIDFVNEKLYWGERFPSRNGTIRRSNLDGTGVAALITDIGRLPTGIAVVSDTDQSSASIPLRVHPEIGGDTGSVTVRVATAFTDTSVVKLARAGEEDIVGSPVTALDEGENCQTVLTTFNLRGKALGTWDLVVDTPDASTTVMVDNDSDNDGVPDTEDQCDASNLASTVVIEDCASGIENLVLDDPMGCTITDEILKLADGAKNHGQFVSGVQELLNALKKAGVLEPKDVGPIANCAAQSSLP